MTMDQTKYLVIDRQKLGQTIKRNLAPLKEKGLLGRPFKLTEDMVLDILEMISKGISYSIISKKHSISKTIVCRIKHKGMDLIEKIKRKKKKESTNTTDLNRDHILYLNKYAEKLQRSLKNKHNIYLNLSDCYIALKEALDEDNTQETRYEYDYEYCQQSEYIELTSHPLYKQNKRG